MQQATIILNEDEAKALTQLIDIAIKAGGLQVAGAGVAIASKIGNAFKPTEPLSQENIEKIKDNAPVEEQHVEE